MPESGGGFSLDMLQLPLAFLGIFGIIAGLGAWLVQGEFGLVPRILIAAGVLLLGIYVALDPENVWSKLTGRGALYSGNTLVLAVAALVIFGLINVLGSRYDNKWDLTANQQYTLAPQSVQIVQNLPQPVHVIAFLGANDSRRQDFTTLLDNFVSKSNGKLSYEFIDPDTSPGAALAAGYTPNTTVIYQMGDKKQTSNGTAQSDVATALAKLELPNKKIYFTTGHGERDLNGTDQTGYSQINTALQNNNFSTATLDLVTQRAVPDDAAEVIIAGPTNPFLPEELSALQAYLEGGGKLMILNGPGSKADFSSILNTWNVAFSGNLVVDPAQNFLNDPRVPVVTSYGSHVITQDLTGVGTFYPGTTNITAPSSSNGTATIVPLAQSSPQSWGNTSTTQIQEQPNDPRGPLTLALAIEANVSSGAQSSGAAPTPTPQSQAQTTRVVLFGTPNLVANTFLQVGSGNQDLFLASANWLAQEDNLINIRPPDTTQRTMLLTGSQMNLIAYSSFLFLPLAVLAAGAAVWWTRR